MKFLFSTLVFVLLIGCSSKFSPNNGQARLRIMHTNDHHGHYLSNSKGEYGIAARKTLVDRLRLEAKSLNSENLLLSGGDINTGTMESDIFDAHPDFLGMNALGYDAMAVGNHEFDNSFQVIQKQRKWAGFPFLSANIFYKGTNKRVFSPTYLIKNIKGFKVGIFGLTTKDTPFKASYQKTRELFEFRNIIAVSRDVVKELKQKEKVDLIIVVTHVGHKGSATSNGDVQLAKAVGGIDVIIGGHSQEVINAETYNDTIIVQAEDWGKYVGVLDIILDKKTGVDKFRYELIPVNLKKKINGKYELVGEKILADSKMEKLFAPFKRKAEIIGKKTVGHLKADFNGDRKNVRARQMPIAQFVGAALMDKVKGIDGAVLNGGSIRAGLKKGSVNRKKIHAVHPYGNTIATVALSAKKFFSYIEFLTRYSKVDPENIIGGYPHFINMKLYFEDGKLIKITAKDSAWMIQKLANGQYQGSKDRFVLGTMNFLANGGDDYPKIVGEESYIDSGFMINSAMMEYVEKKKIIDPKKFSVTDSDILVGF